MYLEYATRMAVKDVKDDLFSIYQNLGLQMQRFVQDNYRCVFTFDRLESSMNTDLIIPLFCQRTGLSEQESKRMVLQSLHLEYFGDYESRFGFRVVYSGPVATFVLYKNKQLRAFEQAAELWQCHHSFAPHGQILDLLSRWDHNRPNTEKLLIHLLFAETPRCHALQCICTTPAFHLGNIYNQDVVLLYEKIRISDNATYERIEAIWRDFLRFLLTY